MALIQSLLAQVDNFIGQKKGGTTRKRSKIGDLQTEKDLFLSKLDTFFVILTCHCEMKTCLDTGCTYDCGKRVHIECNCPCEKKIPVME